MGIFKNSKLSDNLKIFKKSGKDVYCANCGTRTGAITREWLLDDKCLCVNCQNTLPKYYKNNYGALTFETYNVIASYMTGESKELGKQFKKKHTFLDLQLDAANGILRYKPSNAVPLYVKLENIADFSLVCHPRSIEDDFGGITLTLECINPHIFMHEDLELTASENDCYKFMEYYYSIREMREGQNYVHGEQGGARSEFKLKNLTYIDVEFSQDKESMTVTGKPTVESQAFLILKIDDPVYDSFKIEIGKLKAKSGLLFDKVKGDKKIKNILDTITAARDAAIEYDLQN